MSEAGVSPSSPAVSESESFSNIDGAESPPHKRQKQIYWRKIRDRVLKGERDFWRDMERHSAPVMSVRESVLQGEDEFWRDIELRSEPFVSGLDEVLQGEDGSRLEQIEDFTPLELQQPVQLPPLKRPLWERPRTSKYGLCQVHGKALQPAVACSGRHAGKVVCRCPLFYSQTEGNGRECWLQNLYMGDPAVLPESIVAKVKAFGQHRMRWDCIVYILHTGPLASKTEKHGLLDRCDIYIQLIL